MTDSGRRRYIEVIEPDPEWNDGPILAWVRFDDAPDPSVALREAERQYSGTDWPDDARVEPEPVLMRNESEVEAKISGHEFPYYLPCTKRAKRSIRFWRVIRP